MIRSVRRAALVAAAIVAGTIASPGAAGAATAQASTPNCLPIATGTLVSHTDLAAVTVHGSIECSGDLPDPNAPGQYIESWFMYNDGTHGWVACVGSGLQPLIEGDGVANAGGTCPYDPSYSYKPHLRAYIVFPAPVTLAPTGCNISNGNPNAITCYGDGTPVALHV